MFVSPADSRSGRLPSGALLHINDLTLAYGSRQVLDHVSFEVGEGESVAVMGRSGSGKSSLLACILGMVSPDSGVVFVDGEEIRPRQRSRLARIRREKLGVVFQAGELMPELSPSENVMIAGLLAGQKADQARERSTRLLAHLGVPAGERTVGEFSGGERQRVAVARALMNEPRVLLADEPTGSLDLQTRDQVIDTLFGIPAQYGCALVVVTHDPVVAARATRCYWLEHGVLSATSAGQAGAW